MATLRVCFDPPANGAWNMAVDEAAWEHAARHGVPVLRFYRWAPATVSLGYFQSNTDRSRHPASEPLPWVRRHSGGGAIVHDAEWTYSIVWPYAHPGRHASTWLYELVHESLAGALQAHGVCLQLNRQITPSREPPPFLCFQRRAMLDGLVGEHKVLGSAQRRHRHALLQHGSLLWRASRFAPELPGIADLTDVRLSPEEFAEQWSKELARRLDRRLMTSQWTVEERESAGRICAEKYGSRAWNLRR